MVNPERDIIDESAPPEFGPETRTASEGSEGAKFKIESVKGFGQPAGKEAAAEPNESPGATYADIGEAPAGAKAEVKETAQTKEQLTGAYNEAEALNAFMKNAQERGERFPKGLTKEQLEEAGAFETFMQNAQEHSAGFSKGIEVAQSQTASQNAKIIEKPPLLERAKAGFLKGWRNETFAKWRRRLGILGLIGGGLLGAILGGFYAAAAVVTWKVGGKAIDAGIKG